MEEKINLKIAEIKETVRKITKHFSYTEEEINMLSIAYISMILLDDEIEDLLMETLNQTYILFTNDTVLKMVEKLEQRKINEPLRSRLKKSMSTYLGLKIEQKKLENDHLIIISKPKNLYFLFDALIHELKHAINEIFPEFCLTKNSYFYSGLALAEEQILLYEGIDEAFNSFLVKIYLDNIEYLKEFQISDPKINELLANFHTPKKYHYAFERVVELCLPLFESEYLFPKFYYSSLYKNFYELDIALNQALGYTKESTDFFLYLDKLLKEEREKEEIEELDHSYLERKIKIKPYLK